MDSASDMADLDEIAEAAPLLGSSAKAVGKALLVVYWIACLAVIVFGLSQLGWRWPPAKAEPPAVARSLATARTIPAVPATKATPRPAPVKPAHANPTPAEPAGLDFAPPRWWVVALAALSLAGLVLLALLPRRRRDFGRFSGRRHRLGAMR